VDYLGGCKGMLLIARRPLRDARVCILGGVQGMAGSTANLKVISRGVQRIYASSE
jgi:hypothetical protein